MFSALHDDDALFGALASVIRGRVAKFKIKYKNESLFQKIIGRILFFNSEYMSKYTTTIGTTVYFPSREFVEKDRFRAFSVLAHEYVHVLDYRKSPFMFVFLYLFPQVLSLFSLLSLLSLFYSNLWLLSLFSFVFLLPLNSASRLALELRGYAMTLAVDIWRHGVASESLKAHIRNVCCGRQYYRMCDDRYRIDRILGDIEKSILNIDIIGVPVSDTIFASSDAYQDVYFVLTGIEE